MGEIQGMTPIAKIEIAIAIPISICKNICDPDRDRSSAIADLLKNFKQDIKKFWPEV